MMLGRFVLAGAGAVFASLGVASAAPAIGQNPPAASQRRPIAAAEAPQPKVVETQWNLIELNGVAVTAPASGAEPYIYLQEDGDKLSGSDSCNRFFGSYDLNGNSLQFHSVAQTLMACPVSGFTDRDAEFLDALKLVSSYQISEDVLLLKVDDRVLARFRARKK